MIYSPHLPPHTCLCICLLSVGGPGKAGRCDQLPDAKLQHQVHWKLGRDLKQWIICNKFLYYGRNSAGVFFPSIEAHFLLCIHGLACDVFSPWFRYTHPILRLSSIIRAESRIFESIDFKGAFQWRTSRGDWVGMQNFYVAMKLWNESTIRIHGVLDFLQIGLPKSDPIWSWRNLW